VAWLDATGTCEGGVQLVRGGQTSHPRRSAAAIATSARAETSPPSYQRGRERSTTFSFRSTFAAVPPMQDDV